MLASTRVRRAHLMLMLASGWLLVVVIIAIESAQPALAFPPAVNGRLAFDQGDGIVTAEADGSSRLPLAPGGCCPTWAPDGSRLAVTDLTDDGRFTYALVDADGTGRTPPMPIAIPNLNVGYEAWAPNEDLIAGEGFDGVNPSNNGIYVRRASDGGALRLILATPGRRTQVGDFSPDGSRLVFVQYESIDETSRRAIFVLDRAGSAIRRITPWGMAGCCTASWSPDGRWIVFDDHGKLFMIHPDGTGLRQIPVRVDGRAFAFEPDWSPDGSRIAFSMYVTKLGQDDIYTIAPNGTDLVQVTDTPGHEGQVDWGPAPGRD